MPRAPANRPALAAVLGALTGVDAAAFDGRRISPVRDGVFRAPQEAPGLETFAPWLTLNPAEAWEALVTAGLLDESERRLWWCSWCDGARGERGFAGCPACAIYGHGTRPSWHPNLVAVASLGPAVLGAEELCAKVAGELATLGLAVAPCERVVWRVAREPLTPGAVALRAEGAVPGPNPDLAPFPGTYEVRAHGGLWEVRDPGPARLVRTVFAVRELWQMGLALERVGAECVVAVPAIGA